VHLVGFIIMKFVLGKPGCVMKNS